MAESFYLFSNGELRRKDNVLRMTAPDGKFKDIQVEMARDIFLFGEVNLNTKCLNYAGKLSIPLHVFDYYGNYTGSFYPRETNISGRLLVEQVNHYTDAPKDLPSQRILLKRRAATSCVTCGIIMKETETSMGTWMKFVACAGISALQRIYRN